MNIEKLKNFWSLTKKPISFNHNAQDFQELRDKLALMDQNLTEKLDKLLPLKDKIQEEMEAMDWAPLHEEDSEEGLLKFIPIIASVFTVINFMLTIWILIKM